MRRSKGKYLRHLKYKKERIRREMNDIHSESFRRAMSEIGERYPVEAMFLCEYMIQENKDASYIKSLFNSGLFEKSSIKNGEEVPIYSNFVGQR